MTVAAARKDGDWYRWNSPRLLGVVSASDKTISINEFTPLDDRVVGCESSSILAKDPRRLRLGLDVSSGIREVLKVKR